MVPNGEYRERRSIATNGECRERRSIAPNGECRERRSIAPNAKCRERSIAQNCVRPVASLRLAFRLRGAQNEIPDIAVQSQQNEERHQRHLLENLREGAHNEIDQEQATTSAHRSSTKTTAHSQAVPNTKCIE